MTEQVPPDVAAGAARVQQWLDSQKPPQPAAKLSESEFAALNLRDRFAYCRSHDQRPFAANPSPR